MSDMYNRQTAPLGGSFSADQAEMYFAPFTNTGVGLLIQNLGIQYNRQVTRLFEIGSPRQYYVDGRSEGTASIGRVLGPGIVQQVFYKRFGNVCNANSNVLFFKMSNTCESSVTSKAAATLHHVVITSFGLTTNAQSVLINEQLQMMFSFMDMDGAKHIAS